MSQKHSIVVAFFFLIVLFLSGMYLLRGYVQTPQVVKDMPLSASVTIGGSTYDVEIADTQKKRVQGLSGRKSLAEGTGMLFMFDKLDSQGIWMKDMNFDIDILWMDERGEIVHIVEAVSPETYPTVFVSPTLALYVLEFPAGTVAQDNISLGDVMMIDN
jgi:uncharacterized membrane protein (UPF0127 family)